MNPKTTQFNIRTARLSDSESLVALAIQVWLHTYATEGVSEGIAHYVLNHFTVDRFEAYLSDEDSLILVAEDNKHLAGYILVRFNKICPCADA